MGRVDPQLRSCGFSDFDLRIFIPRIVRLCSVERHVRSMAGRAEQVQLRRLQAAADRRQMYSVHRHLAPVNATHEELKAFIIDTGNMGISHQADIAWKSQVDVWKSTLFKLDIGHRNFLYQLREAAFTVRTGRSVLSGSKITFLVADGRRDFNLDQLNESFEDAHLLQYDGMLSR